MKKALRILIIAGAIILAAFIYFINVFAPLIAGYGAKDLCSCVYIGDREVESVLENELGSGFKALGSFTLNEADSSVTGKVFGFAKSKAVYRNGLGCTLIRDRSEKELRAELSSLEINPVILSDTVLWPKGRMTQAVNPVEVDMKMLNEAIELSFINNDPEHPNRQRAVVVVYKGEIIAEQHAAGFGPFTPQIGWSMSKSIINTMFGVLVQKRNFDIYKKAPIPEWKDPLDPRSNITTDHLLRMSTGLEWDEDYTKPSFATKMLYNSSDMGLYASMVDLEFFPDSNWYYSSGTSNILSRILRLELGDEYLQWPFKEIFNKIGVSSALFEVDASNAYVGSAYIWASPRDWARLGLLYLNDGVWNGERILPEGWVDYTKKPTPKSDLLQYGAQFWLNAGDKNDPSKRRLPDCPREVYSMNGYEGQRVFIIPSMEMVVVTMAQTTKGDFDMNLFLSSILESVE